LICAFRVNLRPSFLFFTESNLLLSNNQRTRFKFSAIEDAWALHVSFFRIDLFLVPDDEHQLSSSLALAASLQVLEVALLHLFYLHQRHLVYSLVHPIALANLSFTVSPGKG